MHVLRATNVHRALPAGMKLLETMGRRRSSAHGEVIVFPEPVTTVYQHPTQRVLFWPSRDANPFFHFFEGLWMLAGRNDVAFLKQFIQRMVNFSDDGDNFHGAYGHRWRNHFDVEGGGHPSLPDQLPVIIDRLTKYPEDRRSVLGIWDPIADLGSDTKDPPCNLNVLFSRDVSGALNMTIPNRSNDIIWGAYGANAVHFSMLMEFIAGAIGCSVGRYWQVSNNYHAYTDLFYPLLAKIEDENKRIGGFNPYSAEVKPYPMIVSNNWEGWLIDVQLYLYDPANESGDDDFTDPFFKRVAIPLYRAHQAYKAKEFSDAQKLIDQCWATDWKKACSEWVARKAAKFNREKDDGPTYDASI